MVLVSARQTYGWARLHTVFYIGFDHNECMRYSTYILILRHWKLGMWALRLIRSFRDMEIGSLLKKSSTRCCCDTLTQIATARSVHYLCGTSRNGQERTVEYIESLFPTARALRHMVAA